MRRPPARSALAALAAAGGMAVALVATSAPASAAGPVTGTVAVGKGVLAVRADATASAAKVRTIRNGARITILCQVDGAYVSGRVRRTTKWDKLANGQYVTDAYIRRGAAVPACPPPPPPPPPPAADDPLVAPEINVTLTGKWTLPVPKVKVGGFRTVARPTHDGVDLSHPRNTPIVAASAGTVVTVRCNASTPTCDVDGSVTTTGCGWYVEIRHEAGVVTRYCHMVRQPEVKVGDTVTTGQVIGFVGTSGHSSGPHLHFEVHLGYPATRANAVDPVPFMALAGAPLR